MTTQQAHRQLAQEGTAAGVVQHTVAMGGASESTDSTRLQPVTIVAPASLTHQPPVVTAAILLLACLPVMANAAIAPSLPGLAFAFSNTTNSEALAGVALGLPSLSIVLFAGLFGWLADRVSVLHLLSFVMMVFAIGGASRALAPSIEVLLASRLVLGIGVAGTMTIATMLAAKLWHGNAREQLLGQQFAVSSLAGIVLLVGCGLLAKIHWRLPFLSYLIALPIALYAVLSLRSVLNYPIPITRAQPTSFPWAVYWRVGPLVCFLLLTFFLMPTKLPFLLTSIGIDSPGVTGAVLALITLAAIPGAWWLGKLQQHLDRFTILAAGFMAISLGFAMVASSDQLLGIVTGTLMIGLGFGPCLPCLASALMAKTPENARGRASGLFTMALFTGQFLSPIIAHPFIEHMGIAATFGICSVVMLIVAVIIWMISSRAGT